MTDYTYRASVPPERGAALAAARRGWHVIPLIAGTKRPAVRDWEHWATCELGRIRTTWPLVHESVGDNVAQARRGPRRLPGVGIACGPSGLVVVDLDVPKPGQTPPPQYLGRVMTGEIKTG